MKTLTGYKKLTMDAVLSPPVRRRCSVAALTVTNATAHNITYEMTRRKTKSNCAAYGDHPSIAKCRTKFPATFRGVFAIFLGNS